MSVKTRDIVRFAKWWDNNIICGRNGYYHRDSDGEGIRECRLETICDRYIEEMEKKRKKKRKKQALIAKEEYEKVLESYWSNLEGISLEEKMSKLVEGAQEFVAKKKHQECSKDLCEQQEG